METVPFALSVHHFISSVGADAGFAAFIAVALLVLLFFSQARETANLRRRAEEAGQRVQDLEGQLYALSEQVAALPAEISVVRAAGARVPVAPGVAPAPDGVGAPATAFPPAAPAGVGAPALAAATRLIPDPILPLSEHQPATVGLVEEQVDQATEAHPSPVTVSGGNGTAPRPVPAAATMQRPAQARPGGPSRPGGGPPRGAQGRPIGGQGRPGGPPRSTMAVRPGGRRSNTGRLFTVLAVLLLAGAVVAGVIVIGNINHGSSQSKSSAAAAAARRSADSRRATTSLPVQPSTVTVAVLNGTNTSGLAGSVSNKLGAAGYQKGYVGNFTDNQTQTSTSVLYLRGYKRDATAVAMVLKLHSSAVQPIDQSTQQIACPPGSGPCKSGVVVTVGSDLAGLAAQ